MTNLGSGETSQVRRALRGLLRVFCEIRGSLGRSSSFQTREPVVVPILAPHTVVNKEESVGIVSLLNRTQSRIITAPVSLLPRSVEVIAFGNVRTSVRRKSS